MNLRTVWKYLFNKKEIKEPKKITLNTIRYFIQGNLRSLASNFGIVDAHIIEQAQWRKGCIQDKSPKCLLKGKCEYCECDINESVLSTPGCNHGCYPEMMDKDTWEDYKLKNKIQYVNNSNNDSDPR